MSPAMEQYRAYDEPDPESGEPAHNPALHDGDEMKVVARKVIENLMGRRRIKWGFEEVDYPVRCEIVETLANIIRDATAPLQAEADRLRDCERKEE